MKVKKKKIAACREGADSERLRKLLNSNFKEGGPEITIRYGIEADAAVSPSSCEENRK